MADHQNLVKRGIDRMYGKFNKHSLSEQITDRLLTLIKEDKLHAGEKLPAERELATSMGVSRQSLREALRALAIMNVLEIRQGDGTYISDLSTNTLVEHLDFVFQLNDSTFLELFEARKIFEVGMVEIAATKITDAEIAGLEECLERSWRHLDEHDAFLEVDVEIHQRIAQAVGNSILNRFTDILSVLSHVSRQRTVRLRGVTRQSHQDHVQIVSALRAHDPEASRQAMLTHLEHVREELRKQTDG